MWLIPMELVIRSGVAKISQSDKQLDELTQSELAEYARFGNAVASLCVEKKGAIPAMPKLSQVEERLEDSRWK